MVVTFHLHCLGHRINYGNPEVGNAKQQLLSTTRPCWSIELFWVILMRYNIGIIICIYIYKVSYILFFVNFNYNVFSPLHAKHLEMWKNILCNDESIASKHDPSRDVIFLCVQSESTFPFMEYFFSQENCFLWSSCFLLIAESISLDTSGKPNVAFFLKITSPSWINFLNPLESHLMNSI